MHRASLQPVLWQVTTTKYEHMRMCVQLMFGLAVGACCAMLGMKREQRTSREPTRMSFSDAKDFLAAWTWDSACALSFSACSAACVSHWRLSSSAPATPSHSSILQAQ